jgi:CDP-diacylglycerol--glycerol-3-phosphate 3-phosphatidyltransferase
MDPLADKLLTIAAFVVLLGDWMPGIVFLIVIISRELIVTSIRLIAAEKGIVIVADKWGKLKTVLQMIWICYALLFLACDAVFKPMLWLYHGLLWAVVIVTVGSGINYCIKSRKLFKDC